MFVLNPLNNIAALILLGSAVAASAESGKRAPTITDIERAYANAMDYTSLQLSHDGSMIAYSANGDVWVASTSSAEGVRKVAKGFLPRWSPVNDSLAFYVGESESRQLWLLDLTKGASQLTHLAGGIDPDPASSLSGWIQDIFRFEWSPDGTHIVFASRVKDPTSQPGVKEHSIEELVRKGQPIVLTGDTPQEWTLDGIFAHAGGRPRFGANRVDYRPTPPSADRVQTVSQLFVVDVPSRSLQQLTSERAQYFQPAWSADGHTVFCVSADGRQYDSSGPDATNIHAINLETREDLTLTSGATVKSMPAASPSDTYVAFFESKALAPRFLRLLRLDSGITSDLTSELNRGVQQFQWRQDSRRMYINYVNGVATPIAQVDIQTGHVAPLLPSDDRVRSFFTVAASGAITWRETEPEHPQRVYFAANADAPPRVIVDFTRDTRGWLLAQQEVIRWKSSSGDSLEGLLLKPPGFQPSHHYSLLVDLYPMQTNGFEGEAQTFAARGLLVFFPNPRTPSMWAGNEFSSPKFDEAARGPRGWHVSLDDVMSGVNALIARGYVDSKKMCLVGFSNGAAVVNALVTFTDRFKCAISQSAALSFDWAGTFLLGLDEVPRIVGATPWSDPSAYVELSTLFHLDKIHTPMLLAAGDEEESALLQEVSLFNGLRYLGRDVILLRYPGQGHGFTGAAAQDFWERENAFLDKYLKPTAKSTFTEVQ